MGGTRTREFHHIGIVRGPPFASLEFHSVRVTYNEAVNVITTVPGSASQMRGSINF